MLILNAENDIIGWKDARGVDILFPKQKVKDKLRGGTFICAPQFGNVPTTKPGWEQVKLPRHGLARVFGTAESLQIKTHNGFQITKKTYRQPEGYLYDFNIEEMFRLSFDDTSTTLDHVVRVLRDPNCRNESDMPWMPGWHPYFATHGEEFEVWVGRSVPLTINDRFDPAVRYDWFGQPVKLITKHHQIDFVFHGAEQVVAWTDDKSNYVCFESVSPDTRLKRGMSAHLTSRVTARYRT